ncbi:hypothetical protein GQ42DRAFT_15549 [Ramicandelaber brevisporus]|nr:hypothetical protein GQ42DRAFT_15549 [Ramicandelaber brevisporus]
MTPASRTTTTTTTTTTAATTTAAATTPSVQPPVERVGWRLSTRNVFPKSKSERRSETSRKRPGRGSRTGDCAWHIPRCPAHCQGFDKRFGSPSTVKNQLVLSLYRTAKEKHDGAVDMDRVDEDGAVFVGYGDKGKLNLELKTEYAGQPLVSPNDCESCLQRRRCTFVGCTEIWHIRDGTTPRLHQLPLPPLPLSLPPPPAAAAAAAAATEEPK